MKFHFNHLYNQIFHSSAYEIDITGGRGRGGSHFATDYFLFKIMTSNYFRGYFMRLIHSDIRTSLYQDFKDRIEEKEDEFEIKLLDKFRFNDMSMSIEYLPNGNKIESKGFRKSSSARTAKMKSIAGATDIIIEEFEEIEEDDYRKLRDSIRTTKAQPKILRIWNPPQKDHWILKTYYNLEPHPEYEDYFIYKPKGLPRHLCIYSTYKDNIKNINEVTQETWEDYANHERTLSHYLTDIKGLVSSGAKGQVFKKWELYKDLPEDVYFYKVFGLDWGGADPHAIIELNFDKKQKRVFMREILYQPQILTGELIDLIRQVNPKNHEVVCDAARKDRRYELADAGINVIKADKSKINDDFRRDVIYMAMEYKTFVHQDSENLIFEMQNFKWAIDPNTKEPIDKPEDKHNHLQDSRLYATRYYHTNFGYTYQ
jgi:phage terminase large subunit